MPKIRTYESPINSVTLTDRGTGALASAANDIERGGARVAEMTRATGAAIGGAISRAGDAVAHNYDMYVVQPEISASTALLANKLGDLTQAWNQRAAQTDPNDTTIGRKFLENDVEPEIEKFVNGHRTEDGRRWAEKKANELREHFITKTVADTATRAGFAVTQNVRNMENNYTNMVSNDPSSFKFVEKMLTDSINELVRNSPNLAPNVSAHAVSTMVGAAMKNVAQSAVQGMARSNPAGARAALEGGKFDKYITGEEKTTLLNYVQAQENLLKTAASAERTAEKQRRTDAVNTSASKLLTEQIQVGEDGTLVPTADFFKGAMKLAEMEPEHGPKMVENLVRFGQGLEREANREEKVTSDPAVYNDFLSRKDLPATDPRALTLAEVLDARVKKKLSTADARMWTDYVNADVKDPNKRADMKQLHEFFSKVKSQITKSTLMRDDALGDRAYLRFMQDMTEQFKMLRATKVPVEEMINMGGKFSFWRDLPKYSPTSQQAVEAMIERARPPASGTKGPGSAVPGPGGVSSFEDRFDAAFGSGSVRWKPGESMDDLARRLGGK